VAGDGEGRDEGVVIDGTGSVPMRLILHAPTCHNLLVHAVPVLSWMLSGQFKTAHGDESS
jgi:hypothetical protein